MDDKDWALFELLQQNARMPMADIARELGVSRATAARRLERLLQDGGLHLLAETDIYAAGRELLVVLGIRLDGQALEPVAEALSALEATIAVNVVAGRYDIEVLMAAASHDDLATLLSHDIPAIAGNSERAPGLCLEVLKFASNQVPYL
jgi:DNA-binding Lrp family transcriptional regulator